MFFIPSCVKELNNNGGKTIARDYFDTEEGIIIKNEKGRTTQENLLMKYNFSGDIKKITSPRYMAYKDKINGQLMISKHNTGSVFKIYIEHDDCDIRFQFSYELMSLILEVRNSMYDQPPIINPFYDIGHSKVVFDNLYYTPKLVELLTKKRVPLTEGKRQNILLRNAKEILALKNKHREDILKLFDS